ncbi:MAG: PD40 domain-containing protein [Verrucomicrobia bacterium]|nr:PD40 domain-containing protein [Verrucomicrobiota bacterium]
MKNLLLRLSCAFAVVSGAFAQTEKPHLLQSPTLGKTQIVFAYGSSLWSVAREGGEARRLVVGDPGSATGPLFSPDGSLVAFTGNFDTNEDVYVVPAAGGEPRRLTTHPGTDVALAWTPDGKRILFRSSREAYSRFERLFTVSVAGGFPTEVPLPMGVQGAYSADATQLAYVPTWNRRGGAGDTYIAIKNYRGGKTSPIWIASLADSSVMPLPRENSNDFNPMWVGDQIYFLSDRAGATTLFSYDVKSRAIVQLIKNDGFDLKSAGAGPGAIVYEQFGSLHLFDFASGRERAGAVRISADLPQTRPHFEKILARQLSQAAVSPTGARAIFETHGEIVTVPAEKGDIRNLTRTPATADRDPSWSPDGKTIAYFSDESGDYALHLRDQNGLGTVRKIDLGPSPTFFYNTSWSPDSKEIAYGDKRGNFWLLDLAAGKPVKFDTDPQSRGSGVKWSPDSKWLAYVKQLPNNHRAVFVYSLDSAAVTQVTDGMSDARSPDWDKSGKYLYFTASTDLGLSSVGFNMSSNAHPVTRAVYLAVLAKSLPSPLAPESDEEKDDPKDKDAGKKPDTDPKIADAEKPADDSATKSDAKPAADSTKEKDKKPVKVVIDFEGLSQRILALPLPEKNYGTLTAGKEGIIYVLEGPQVAGGGGDGGPKAALQRFDLKTRKTEKILDGVEEFHLAAKGEKMLWKADAKWFIGAADKAPKPGEGALKLDSLEVWVEPRAEWRQMFKEVWRIERDFFYDANFHGIDLAQAERIYAPFLDGIGSRADLNYLFSEMLGQLSVQHMYVAGGAKPDLKEIKVGLLGADYKIAGDRYQFARVFDGENWNPQAKAPLTQPGVNVKPGEFLLAVNGRELRASDEIFSFFAGTVSKQTVLRVGPNADGTGARDVTVVPIATEASLRNLAWIEGNRRKVDELSGGKLAYVYVPDTAMPGYTSFNRYFFAQVGKQGAVIDERFNGGGQLADYIVDYLNRPLRTRIVTREGAVNDSPGAAIFGPKAMLINEFAGSGGDALPWYFRKAGTGTLIGTRTWGGLVGIGGYPALIDGGTVTAPRMALYDLNGKWEVENVGIAPDIEVQHDPKLVRQGRDPQLEKAVAVVMAELKKNPPKDYPIPPYPKYPPRWPAK